jgi:hypothetical protein
MSMSYWFYHALPASEPGVLSLLPVAVVALLYLRPLTSPKLLSTLTGMD